MESLNRWLEQHFEEMTADLADLVKIPSVKGKEEPGAPFGKEVSKALDRMLELAHSYGFNASRIEDCMGVVSFGGSEGQKADLGVLAHLDVVPAGEGWGHDPFTMRRESGKLIGRGVIDDKGPGLAALYALRAIKEICGETGKKVELLFGTDEENGSGDLKRYLAGHELPPMLFTPDGGFPVINVEKGMMRTTFGTAVKSEGGIRVKELHGGVAVNALPAKAAAVLEGEGLEAVLATGVAQNCGNVEIEVELEGSSAAITAKGCSAHASTPEKGENALTGLLSYLDTLNLAGDTGVIIKSLAELFPHGDWQGKALGVAVEHEKFGHLTHVFSVLEWKNGSLEGRTDMRFPPDVVLEDMKSKVKSALTAKGFEVRDQIGDAPHQVPEESEFVKTLLEVYTQQTGEKGYCVAIGGGTYVHNTAGGVAFGPVFPNSEDNRLHGVDEFITEESLLLNAKLYAQALYRLMV